MSRKTFVVLLLYFLFTSCGYTPIYSSKNETKFNIQIENYEGDLEVNSEIVSKLRIHKNSGGKLFKLNFSTDYQKRDLSKDLTGKIQNYELIIKSEFRIYISDLEKTFAVTEKFTMRNFEDDFEEKNYERKIKETLANLIYQKLMVQLSRLQ